ncbi:hypothetical protein B0D78_08120 [Pyramidobacter sp. C12-8]|nr:hypothetical protein B0D78_08120 [Pyramidobacter sp. C12-8]
MKEPLESSRVLLFGPLRWDCRPAGAAGARAPDCANIKGNPAAPRRCGRIAMSFYRRLFQQAGVFVLFLKRFKVVTKA